MASYEIEIQSYSFQSPATEQEEMNGLRLLCTDLTDGIDQAKSALYHGEDGMEHHSIFVETKDVREAVRRINEAGYATDADNHADVIEALDEEFRTNEEFRKDLMNVDEEE